MKPFQYRRPKSLREAIDMVTSTPDAHFIAGGTNLIDLMKRGVVSPGMLVDINHLPLKKIEYKNQLLRIGALVLNSAVSEHQRVRDKHPLLVQAIQAGASGQLRNMATMGGNILQRSRCNYFYDTAFPCNKRTPDSGCSAIGGVNRSHAILGLSDHQAAQSCIAVHPSDMCVALAALDAKVIVAGPAGERSIPFADVHRIPGQHPDKDTTIERNELIVAVEIPDTPFTQYNHYLKIRDRASYAFALVSVAAALDIDNRRIRTVRVAMGGVAHKPWRLIEAEKLLTGQLVSEAVFTEAATVSMLGARAFEQNGYKIKLASNAISEALRIAAGLT
jgi:xanthine dehydrogenase YagS FAD-binding subunit